MSESCETCRYSREHPEVDGTLECRIMPPTTAGWPTVGHTDWCAQWIGEGEPPEPPPVDELRRVYSRARDAQIDLTIEDHGAMRVVHDWLEPMVIINDR